MKTDEHTEVCTNFPSL